MHRYFQIAVAASFFVLSSGSFSTLSRVAAQERIDSLVTPEPQEPFVQPASGEGQLAIKQFKFATELNCELFAAEPHVANIVAFQRDFQGRFFVCETFRQEKNTGVEDNRGHSYWMDDELQARTVQDRMRYILKHIPDAAEKYTAQDDRIRLVLDRDGDGVADHAQVFANGFNRLEMGTGADVLSYRNSVYYTCIPDLFKLSDTTGDGVADQRESLLTGFGVRFAFRGHDLHGLIVGPDGRLYFSIGDRGYHVSPSISDPASGAVFRCELDGSNLEVVCTGLRNPQNLAFDDFGNLFTGDNNSDSGDQARWVYLVPGGDSGWRMYYQYLPDRGPFNREKIWHPYHAESPAYIIPPVENISDGPSGLEYYPGTGFGDDFLGRFFLCDFRGSSVNSGVRSFRNEPLGAFFKLVDAEQPVWGILTTDLQFGSDGKLYISDWVNGWVGEGKGRIYAFSDPSQQGSEIVKEVEQLLREGLSAEPKQRLISRLGHRDRRVRQEAQFELVQRGEFESLRSIAEREGELLPRVHAIWGLAQLGRRHRSQTNTSVQTVAPRSRVGVSDSSSNDQNLVLGPFNPSNGSGLSKIEQELLKLVDLLCVDKDAEVRAQAAYLAREISSPSQNSMVTLLRDENLRVRYFAALALEKIGDARCLPSLAEMLIENKNIDPIVRHGGIMAFWGVLRSMGPESDDVELDGIRNLARHDDPNVRLALTVAIRKVVSLPPAEQAAFPVARVKQILKDLLEDADGIVCLEAARIVYDVPVNELMSDLATVTLVDADKNERLPSPGLQVALASRVIEANLRIGDQGSAERLAALAAVGPDPTRMQSQLGSDALRALIRWMTPPNNDPLIHDWRPMNLSDRQIVHAQSVIHNRFSELVAQGGEARELAFEAAGALEITRFEPALEPVLEQAIFSDQVDTRAKMKALKSLHQMNYAGLDSILSRLNARLTNSNDEFPLELAVEMAAIDASENEARGFAVLERIIDADKTTLQIKQQAIRSIGDLKEAESKQGLLNLLSRAKDKTLAPELRLDVVVAARRRNDDSVKQAADEYLRGLASADDPSAEYEDTLVGGEFGAGQVVFESKAEVSCIRCHRVWENESAVGPSLAGIGSRRTRRHILDSIVQPNKEISEGFGQVKVQTIDGLMQTGLLVEESENQIRLMDADGKMIVIPQEDVEEIQSGLSSMPLDLVKNLSLDELRDLIEFLAKQTAAPADSAKEAPAGHGE